MRNVIIYGDELYHHGILGQKWGVRNGPPYPLDEDDYSAKEQRLNSKHLTRAEKKKNYAVRTDIQSKEQHISDRALSRVLSVVTNTYNVIEDYMKTNGSVSTDDIPKILLETGKRTVRDIIKDVAVDNAKRRVSTYLLYDKYFEKNKRLMENHPSWYTQDGVRKKQSNTSLEDDVTAVNPKYSLTFGGLGDLVGFGNGSTTNCGFCTTAYDLRRRGYDVVAPGAYGMMATDTWRWFKGAKVMKLRYDTKYSGLGISKASAEEKSRRALAQLTKNLESQGEGARGNVCGVYKGYQGGHSIAYEVKNGKVLYIDAQIGQIYKDPYNDLFSSFDPDRIQYVRTDNCEPNFKMMQLEGVIVNRT